MVRGAGRAMMAFMFKPLRGVVTAIGVGALLTACGGAESATAPTTPFTLIPTTTVAATTTTSTSTTTTSSTAPTISTTTPATAPTEDEAVEDPAIGFLELSGEGIGAAAFTSEPEGVIAFVESFLGVATFDSGWVDPFTFGSCAGTEIRLVSWGALTATFGDVSQFLSGQRHFLAFSYGTQGDPLASPVGLRTPDGITVGTRLIDLLAAHPSAELNPSDEFTPSNFVINDNLRGLLSGLADDSIVTSIFGGQGCGE